MDISLFYQLRDRLYASAGAGCNVINEDFRLKRAVESFEPLSKANKVFAKLYSMCNELFTSEKPAPILADCIALCDALAVTQGTFKDNSITFEKEGVKSCKPSEIRYSVLSNLNGNIESKDPRIINWYLNSLESNTLKSVINFFGKDLVPMLKEKVDLTNPKEKGNIVEYVGILAGADENDWYISLAENEENPIAVRSEAVANLAYDKSNAERLLEIYNTSKGKVKDSAGLALVKLDTPESEIILKKITAKFAKKNVEYIKVSRNKIAIDFALEYAEKAFEIFNKTVSERKNYDYDLAIEMLKNKPEAEDVLFYLSNQDGKIIRMFYTCNMLIENLAGNNNEEFRVLIENLYRRNPEYFGVAYVMLNELENRGVKNSELTEIINKHRDFFIRKFENIKYDNVKKCYILEKNSLNDGKIDDILELLTDTSYLANKKKLLPSKKNDEENNFKDLYSERACNVLKNIFNSACESDKDKIYKYMIEFYKAVVNTRPNECAFKILCINEQQYIKENPHLVEDLVMYNLESGWISDYIIEEIPRDIIDTAIIPLYKKLRTLQNKRYKNGNISMQIMYIERFLNNNGYDTETIKF